MEVHLSTICFCFEYFVSNQDENKYVYFFKEDIIAGRVGKICFSEKQ